MASLLNTIPSEAIDGPWIVVFDRSEAKIVPSRSDVVVIMQDSADRETGIDIEAVPLLLAMQSLEMLASMGALLERASCYNDFLNPCWDNRPNDIPGKHWAGGEACRVCRARAILAAAEGTRP